jgi:hypothetical protein
LQLLLPLLLLALPRLQLLLKATSNVLVCPLPVQMTVRQVQAQHVQVPQLWTTKATHGHWSLPVLAKQWNCQQRLMAPHAWGLWKLLSATCQHKRK